jgi:DNA-binding transcriptional LysR family regulator
LLHVAGQRRGWAEWLALAGLAAHPQTSILQIDSPQAAIIFAEQGLGVALGHASYVEPLIRAGRLARPFSTGLETVGIFYLITPSTFPLRRQARLLRDWLLTEASEGVEP